MSSTGEPSRLGTVPDVVAMSRSSRSIAGDCPDTGGECPEWACTACGAAVIMGTLPDAAPAAYRTARAA